MCGRYTQLAAWSDLVTLYRITATADRPNLAPHYNAAPTQMLPVVRRSIAAGRELLLMRWGLVPSWAKDLSFGARTINARAETVHRLPSFRAAFCSRRCLVPADGFYEWRKRPAGGKQPYLIRPATDAVWAFAGLWETWQRGEAETVLSFTIIVGAANPFLQPIHDRMPVILHADAFDTWLDPQQPTDAVQAMLAPYADEMTVVPVSSAVNNVRNDDPRCIAPVGGAVTAARAVELPEPSANPAEVSLR
jgi:Uncharacterized conserved protein